MNESVSRFLTFSRDEWAVLRAATPMTLREDDLSKLRGINENASTTVLNHVESDVHCGPIEIGFWILLKAGRYLSTDNAHKNRLQDILGILVTARNAIGGSIHELRVVSEILFEFLHPRHPVRF